MRLGVLSPAALSSFSFQRGNNLATFNNAPSPVLLGVAHGTRREELPYIPHLGLHRQPATLEPSSSIQMT